MSAITREEQLLQSVSDGTSSGVSPITREEQYLAFIAGETSSYPMQPITRKEQYLKKIAQNGTGGGSSINVQSLSVTSNGTYAAPSGTAYSPVIVSVQPEVVEPNIQPLNITENGTYEADGVDGYAPITVNVTSGGGGDNQLDAFFEGTATELSLPTVTKIGQNVFYRNSSLVNIEMPNVTSIEEYSFSECTNLALTSLPSGITSLGRYSFNQCTNLALTEIPSGVTSIGKSAFGNCTNLLP